MGNTAEWQRNRDGVGAVSSSQEATAQAVLDKLTRWRAVIDARMQAQMTLLEVLEEFLLVQLRTHYYQGNVDVHFLGALLDTTLLRMSGQAFEAYDAERDAPYRWPGGADFSFPAERRDVVTQAVEGAAFGFINHYEDYLRRHWKLSGGDASLHDVLHEKLEGHMAGVAAIFQPDRLAGRDVDELREAIEAREDAWRRMGQLSALATRQERHELAALASRQVPDWLRGLGEADRKRLEDLHEEALQAQALVDEQLDGLGSLKDFARSLAKDYVRHELDMEVEPDGVRVKLQWRTIMGQPMRTYSLSELVAGGAIRPDAISVVLVENGTMLRNEPISAPFMAQLLANVDAPAEYLPALSTRYHRADLKNAMFDWFLARLQHSAFVARCAGQMTTASHDRLGTAWSSESSEQAIGGLRVSNVELPDRSGCADLLLFYCEDPREGVTNLLLYAPGKPDGQEWISLPSLRAVSAEIGGWAASEAGREYLLQQMTPGDRVRAREYLVNVMQKPTSWDLSKDPRRAASGFKTCIEQAVLTGLSNNLMQVEMSESPRWYSRLSLDSRRTISGLGQELLVHQQLFGEQLAGYEVFLDFAKRTVTQAIAPYMRSKGVDESVDPSTVLIEFYPGLTGSKKVASLLELAIYGYDDNAGIDHPARGVRSTVGQDLRQVRSADLARYIRSAYLGERYAREVRSRFLDANDPAYLRRRDVHRYMLLARMERDLRIAYGQSALSVDAFRWLTRQITLLGERKVVGGPTSPSAVVAREGVHRLTVNGHVVLGVYLFTYFDPKGVCWLYTPDAPDGLLFRNYGAFRGRTAAQLHDYILERVALTARASVARSLLALAADASPVDTLREFNRVVDIGAEFDAFIERAITDVEDITTSRAEVIQHQVVKGLLFAAAPACMIYPPFAVLLDVAFVGISTSQAIEAHARGDTQEALEQWLVASWGSLFAVLGAASVAPLLGRSAMNLKLMLRPLSLSAQRLRRATPVAAKETGLLIRPIRLKPRQAVQAVPENLQPVVDDGIFHGTYRSAPSASQPRATYYIRSQGRYFQVREDPYFGGLCLVDSSRPGALYQLPIRRMTDGRWVHDKVGLRGGNNVRNLGRVRSLHEAFPGHVSPNVTRGALQGEAVVAASNAAAADNYLFSLNAQTCVVASLYNPTTRVGAVIHFDHNIHSLIERSVRDVMGRLGGRGRDIRVTLVGGDWLTGGDIGGVVRSVMRRRGLRPTWDYWSYSSCFGNTYGISLDLGTGVTSVFKMQPALTSHYLWGQQGLIRSRMDRFKTRFRRPALPTTPEETELYAFPTVVLR
ncbi:type III effector 1 [Pseudomonas sp. T1.Ur]|uniref:dermonecrotic toxin domain-containing protein n=1 Tax=Pseudomonas sp. T1.Ur TaxID=2928704 RepID=UPI00201D92DE|nr:type III effector 1 [Pseudomonas sp. T1.Ur]MCL6704031.1 type III effector 1 [Pseudomonas sp. T1.Ur]